MRIKVGNEYKGKISGEFKLEAIKRVNGKHLFVISTTNHDHIELNLTQMREEKPKALEA